MPNTMEGTYLEAAIELAHRFAARRGDAVAFKQYFGVGAEWFVVTVARCAPGVSTAASQQVMVKDARDG